jgi:stage V sporulation protein G
LNEVFAVCDLKIIKGNKGLFVAMPSRRRRDGTFHDVAHPICQTLRDHIERVVLIEYNMVVTQHGHGGTPTQAPHNSAQAGQL